MVYSPRWRLPPGCSRVNVVQVGVDIIEIGRVQRALDRFGARFRQRVFTLAELEETNARVASLAARFAAKEATIKALGHSAIALHEIEVVRLPGGRPALRLHGRAAARAAELGVVDLAVSLSHSREYAVAVVVLSHAAGERSGIE